MDVSDLVESKWLTANDVRTSNSKTLVVVSAGVLEDAISMKGDKYKTLVLPVELDGKKKDWKLNRSSLKKFVERHGKDTSAWVGKPIKVTTILLQGGKEGITLE